VGTVGYSLYTERSFFVTLFLKTFFSFWLCLEPAAKQVIAHHSLTTLRQDDDSFSLIGGKGRLLNLP
jgi:hypothetical protein